MLFDVVLAAEEWTPENGMLTAAMKVNRGNVKEAFRESIEVSFLFIFQVNLITDVIFFFRVGMC